jgi:hypothetical protein
MIEAGNEIGLALLVVASPPSGLRPIPQSSQPYGAQAGVSVAGYPSSLSAFSVVDTTVASLRGRDVFLSKETEEGFSGGPVVISGAVVGIVYGHEAGFGKALGASSVKPFIEGNSLVWEASSAPQPGDARENPKLAGAWPNGSNIRIRFLNGSASQIQKVEQVAKEWLRYANLTYTFSDTPTADARIVFSDNNIASWSFRGTEAHEVPPTCPTMTLVRIANDTIISAYDRALILHEVGHLLGLLDEIQNPNANIPWRQEIRANPAPYVYISEVQECPAPLNRPVTYQESLAHYRSFDPKSIMMAPLPKEYLTKEISYGGAGELSASDKEFVAQLYPKL